MDFQSYISFGQAWQVPLSPFCKDVLGSALLHISSFIHMGFRYSQDHEPSLHIHGENIFVYSLSKKNKVLPSGPHGLGLPILDPAIVKKDELLR